jgi:hypothetical protein
VLTAGDVPRPAIYGNPEFTWHRNGCTSRLRGRVSPKCVRLFVMRSEKQRRPWTGRRSVQRFPDSQALFRGSHWHLTSIRTRGACHLGAEAARGLATTKVRASTRPLFGFLLPSTAEEVGGLLADVSTSPSVVGHAYRRWEISPGHTQPRSPLDQGVLLMKVDRRIRLAPFTPPAHRQSMTGLTMSPSYRSVNAVYG